MSRKHTQLHKHCGALASEGRASTGGADSPNTTHAVSRARFTLPYVTTVKSATLIVATQTLRARVPVLPFQSEGQLLDGPSAARKR